MNTLRQSCRPLARRLLPAHRRLLASDAPTLYTATATTQGPRGGHITGSEGLQAAYAMPRALGGPGGGGGARRTNPEELLAAGYSSCFQAAMNLAAVGAGRRLPGTCRVTAAVELRGSVREMDMGFRVRLEVRAEGMPGAELEEVVARAREICPYYRAMRGQVETDIRVVRD